MTFAAIPLLALILGQPDSAKFGPGDHLCAFEMGGFKRTYWVHVPPSYDPAKPTPLVLVLHGATMSAKVMEKFTDLNTTADRENFVVVYPNGTGANPLLYTWNAGGTPAFFARTRPDDVAFLARVLDELEAGLNVDRNRVFATGISNGGMMCYRLAAELSERIAAIAPVSGTIALEKYEPKRPVPVLHIHGTKDSLVPYEGATPTIAMFVKFWSVNDTITACVKCNGCAAKPKTTELPRPNDEFKITRQVYGPCQGAPGRGCAEVILYTVENGGHTWPGAPYSGGLLGEVTMNMQANDVIWDFFRKHGRR